MVVVKGSKVDHARFEAAYNDANGNFNIVNLLDWGINVRFKKLRENAIAPEYAHDTDAGMDLRVSERHWDDSLGCWSYGSGIAMEIPQGYVGLLFPRSSICKTKVALTNSVGVIDSGYRGEITAVFRDVDYHTSRPPYKVGEKFAQLIIIPYPKVNLEEVEELSNSSRGTGGYGSTGN